MLQRIVEAAVELVDARYGALGVLDEAGTGLAQFVTAASTTTTRARSGICPRGSACSGCSSSTPKPLRLADLRGTPTASASRPTIRRCELPRRADPGAGRGVRQPLPHRQARRGVHRRRRGRGRLAAAAAVAVENARLHSRVQAFALLEDRERIARDLHDTVIQRLFATGLSLQRHAGLARRGPRARQSSRIEAAVDDLDVTVKHIRSAIFKLETSRV